MDKVIRTDGYYDVFGLTSEEIYVLEQLQIGCISILWAPEDVQSVRPDLNEDQAKKVLKAIEDHHDADEGVNWDSIKTWAQQLFPKPADFNEHYEEFADDEE